MVPPTVPRWYPGWWPRVAPYGTRHAAWARGSAHAGEYHTHRVTFQTGHHGAGDRAANRPTTSSISPHDISRTVEPSGRVGAPHRAMRG